MLFINDRIRNMSEGKRVRFYLFEILTKNLSHSQIRERLDEINKILHGRKLTDPVDDLNLKIVEPPAPPVKGAPPIPPTVQFDWEGKLYSMDLAILDRKDFKGAKPEDKQRPIQPFLTKEELDELDQNKSDKKGL